MLHSLHFVTTMMKLINELMNAPRLLNREQLIMNLCCDINKKALQVLVQG
jgi:hypothetical protein